MTSRAICYLLLVGNAVTFVIVLDSVQGWVLVPHPRKHALLDLLLVKHAKSRLRVLLEARLLELLAELELRFILDVVNDSVLDQHNLTRTIAEIMWDASVYKKLVKLHTVGTLILLLTEVAHRVNKVVDSKTLDLVVLKQVAKRGIFSINFLLPVLA